MPTRAALDIKTNSDPGHHDAQRHIPKEELMARITPNSGSTLDLTTLEDDEPYKGVLKKPKDGWFSTGAAEYGSEERLTVDWVLEDGESIRDWISLRLGKSTKTGAVSKLRMLLNALSEKPRDTEIVGFTTETLEWEYEVGKPFNKITEGMEVIFRGVKGFKADGTTEKFTIQKYQAPKAKAAAAAKRASKADVVDVDPDEIPF